MRLARKSRKTQKPTVKRRITKSKLAQTGKTLSPQEIASLEDAADRQQKSERAWLSMTKAPEEDDRWTSLEEALRTKALGRGRAQRRWKYFAK